MSEFDDVPLGELAAPKGLIGGPFGSSLGRKDYVAEGVPVIRGQNLVRHRRFNSDEFVYVTKEKATTELARNLAEPGDVIFTQRGTLGQVGLVPPEPYPYYVISQSQMRLRVDVDRALPEFIYYCFRDPAMIAAIESHAIVTGVPHINLGILANLRVPYVSVKKQSAIVSVLGALDDKIDSNQRTIQVEEELATWQLDQAPERVRLQDVATVQRTTIDPATSGSTMIDHFSLPAFDERRLPIRQAGAEIKSGKLRIDVVSILVSRLNPHIPRVWYAVPEPGVLSVASTEFVVLTPLGDVTPEELWACCNSAGFISTLAESVTGTTGSHQRVQAADVLSTEVGDPRSVSATERPAINAMVKSAFLLRTESVALAALRDTLLPKLLSGELRVRDSESLIGELV